MRYPAEVRASDGPAPLCLGPVEIDGMTVMLRTPRLSDGASWRETNLRYEKRLAPAFGRTDMSWSAAHSPYMWIHTWKQALSDAAQGWVSCLLVHLDGGCEHVVGHLAMAGRHPRTGGTEVSTWTAGVPHTVTMWAQASLIIAGFEANSNIPHAVAPLADQNVPVQRLAQAVGWSKLQTCRKLRMYVGSPPTIRFGFRATPQRTWPRYVTRETRSRTTGLPGCPDVDRGFPGATLWRAGITRCATGVGVRHPPQIAESQWIFRVRPRDTSRFPSIRAVPPPS